VFPAIFLFINLLFAVRYGPRLSIPVALCAVGFALFVAVQIALTAAGTAFAVRRQSARLWLLVVVAAYLVAAYAVYGRMDPYALNADRWSALLAFHDTLFRGEFPWTATTHLGTKISGFPGMHALALPFYLIGDVGLLQFAAIAGLALLMLVRFRDAAWPLYLLVMLLAMPAIQYEVFVRSDLLGNSVVIAALMHASLRPGAARGRRLYLWAIAWGLALATRALFVIPLVLVAWKLVDGRGVRASLAFAALVTATFAVTFVPFYLWDPVLFWEHNPWRVQSGYATREVLAFVLVGTFVLGYLRRRSAAVFLDTGLLLFLTILLCWGLRVLDVGWAGMLWYNGFDLTYFSLCIPFLIVAWGDRASGLFRPAFQEANLRSPAP